jgi:glycerol-3-phosphate O-acyltransferase
LAYGQRHLGPSRCPGAHRTGFRHLVPWDPGTAFLFTDLCFLDSAAPNLEDIQASYDFFMKLFENDLNLKYVPRGEESPQAAMQYFLAKNYIECDETAGVYQVTRPHKVGIFQQLYMNFLESYYVVIVTVLVEAADGKIEQKSLTPRATEIGKLLYAKGDLGKHESTSSVNLDLAVKLLVHLGVIETRSEAPEAKGKGKAKRKKANYYFVTEFGKTWLEETKKKLEKLLLS